MENADKSEETKMLTVTEVANQLHVNRRTIARAIQRGTLPATPYGSIWLISPADVARYTRGEGGRRGRRKGAPPATPPEELPVRKREHYALFRAKEAPPEPVGSFTDLATMPETEPEMPAGASSKFLYTLPEAAAFLGIRSARGTLGNQIARERLTAITVNKKRFITITELKRYRFDVQGKPPLPDAPFDD